MPETVFAFGCLPPELLVNVFINLDGISQHTLRRVDTRWNAVLRSFPVTRYTTIVQLEAQSRDVTWWYHMHDMFTASSSAEVTNLIIRSVRYKLSHLLVFLKLDDYWPNLRTLGICCGCIFPMPYRRDLIHEKYGAFNGGLLKLGLHHASPFGLLATPKLRWIVLKDVDIGVLAKSGGGLHCGEAFEIVPSRNPYNGGKLGYNVKMSGKPYHTVATIHHKAFPISFGKDADEVFLDILEKECRPVAVSERLEFSQWMSSFSCPYFEQSKKFLMIYLARLDPNFKDTDWEGALERIAEWRNVTFRSIVNKVAGLKWPYAAMYGALFCCGEAESAFQKRCVENGFGSNTYEEAIADHLTVDRPYWVTSE